MKMKSKHTWVIILLSLFIIGALVAKYAFPHYSEMYCAVTSFLNTPISEVKLFELMIALVLIKIITE